MSIWVVEESLPMLLVEGVEVLTGVISIEKVFLEEGFTGSLGAARAASWAANLASSFFS